MAKGEYWLSIVGRIRATNTILRREFGLLLAELHGIYLPILSIRVRLVFHTMKGKG